MKMIEKLPEMRIEHYRYKNVLELAAYIAKFKTVEMEKAFAELLMTDLHPPMIITAKE